MIRVLIFFAIILLVAFGASWLADHPGTVLVTFAGQEYQASTLTGFAVLVAAAAALILVWTLLRFIFRIPSLMSVAAAARKRQRGYHALSRGMVAVGSGDAETARRHAVEATRLLKGEPMALLLQAQAAQLSGDRKQAESTFAAMLSHPDTRVLALRGLHMEALRHGDPVSALAHAEEAQKIATLPWAAQTVLQSRAEAGDWAGALKSVERNAGARITDRPTANRQRAVLLTAMARDAEERNPEEALAFARDALKLAPALVPAASLAGRLLARKGDIKRAARTIEIAYAETPHPELAEAYLHLRHGDSASDRLERAETLARCAPSDAPESHLTIARAALDARDFAAARAAMGPLVEVARPTRRACLAMADIEEAEHGETGALFEWLHRASRAARDPTWIADGVASSTWAPQSPVSGKLDAFAWETPREQLMADHDARTVPPAETSGLRRLPTQDKPGEVAELPKADDLRAELATLP